jgi:hypothetical protein
MGREGGPGSGSSGFSDGLLRARRWKAPGGKPRSRAATPRALAERLGRRRRCRNDPVPVVVRRRRGCRGYSLRGRSRGPYASRARESSRHGRRDSITSMRNEPRRCERRSPPPKEVAAAIAKRWSSRTGASCSRSSSDGVATPLAWPLFERRAGRPCGDRGTHRASRVDETAEALFVTCSRPALKRSGRGEDARDRVAGSSERRRDEEGASDRSEARDHSRGSADSV